MRAMYLLPQLVFWPLFTVGAGLLGGAIASRLRPAAAGRGRVRAGDLSARERG